MGNYRKAGAGCWKGEKKNRDCARGEKVERVT